MIHHTGSAEETVILARQFVDELLSVPGMPAMATIVALSGELGAGKTTFTKGVARALNVPDMVTSPTFVIEKIYYLDEPMGPFRRMIHIDAYRLEDPKELESIGWYEIASDPENLVLIEWPERVEELMPHHGWRIIFTYDGGDSRTVEMVPPAA